MKWMTINAMIIQNESGLIDDDGERVQKGMESDQWGEDGGTTIATIILFISIQLDTADIIRMRSTILMDFW